MMWDMGDGWGWWMMVGWVWMLVFWGLIIWAVVTVIDRLGGERRSAGGDALDILERRYARGELNHDEFEEMRRRLTGKSGV